MVSSPYELIVDFSEKGAILASGVEELGVDVPKLPTAITQIVYRAPGVKWSSLTDLTVVFKTFVPLICKRNKTAINT